MTTTPDPEIIPHVGFDPVAFWMAHKTKVIIYSVLLIIAAASYAAYEISAQKALANSRESLAQASSEDDYRQVIQKFPHTMAAGDASLLLAEKLRAGQKYDEATAVLQSVIDNQPKYPLVDAAWLSLACTYNAQGKTELALSTYQQIISKFPDSFSAPQALVSMGDILQAEGKTEDAMRAYENVNAQFPKSDFAGEAIRKLQLLKK